MICNTTKKMSKIEITTSQNVTIEFETPTLIERGLVFLIDLISVWVAIFIIYIPVYAISDSGFDKYMNYLGIMILVTGNLILQLSTSGKTLGRMIFGFNLIKINGDPVSVIDLILRWAFRIIDIIAGFGAIGAMFILSSEKNQRLGDYLADTVMIKVKKINRIELNSILNLDNKLNYTPIYTEIKHFEESEILLIKETTDRYLKHKTSGNKEAVKQLTIKMAKLLNLDKKPKEEIKFLKTLVNDYAFLTR